MLMLLWADGEGAAADGADGTVCWQAAGLPQQLYIAETHPGPTTPHHCESIPSLIWEHLEACALKLPPEMRVVFGSLRRDEGHTS